MSITITPLNADDAVEVAKLHMEGIATGFISSLGPQFVTALYKTIAGSKYSFGFVAQENDKIIGFVAFTTNLNALYKSIVLKKGVRFIFLLAEKVLSLQRIKKVFETLFYPHRIKKMNLPKAELLSMSILDEARGRGLAAQLTQRGFAECAKRGITKVKVMVAAENEPANRLYIKCGFKFVQQIMSHGIKSNIYVAEIAPAK